MKTSELTGDALDWAVAICENWRETIMNGALMLKKVDASGAHTAYRFVEDLPYSQHWGFAGPIIEREWIDLHCVNGSLWEAECPAIGGLAMQNGPTPLAAAMRCYIAIRLGDEVNIPKELQ